MSAQAQDRPYGPRLVVRAATASDVRAIAEFQTVCWREAYEGLVPDSYLDRVDADAREARWLARAGTRTRNVAVGHVGSTLAGVVSWNMCAEPAVPPLELKSLYVGAAFYGTGVAATLMTHALGDEPAHLWVYEANARALAFYAKWGFAYDGHRKVDEDTGVWERRLVRL